MDTRIEHGLAVIERDQVRVMRRGDAEYPVALEHLHDPPPVLFARGRMELLERPVLGLVGTRRCTRDGRDFTHEIASAVVSAGGVVMSGLALGIDGVAHQAALPATVAVLGCGIDVYQPPSHRALQDQIAREGLLLTEYPPGSEALPFHFPQRNRLIAALSKAVLVVEAPERSGALITADHATDIGVQVMAVPGPPRRHASLGTNALLRDGAALVMEPRDALDALGLTPRRVGRRAALASDAEAAQVTEPVGLDGDALALWRAAEVPGHVDELAERAGLSASSALSALFELELLGLVRRAPGQKYQRV
jgi:DNA processing protein